MDATRISDGRPVMLKQLLTEEGPYELEVNRLFSTEPLSSNVRNHCVQLLDVVELSGDPPIMVHPLLRPFYDPPLQTYGEFVTFFAQTCEVRSAYFHYTIQSFNGPGCPINAREPCRSPVRCQHLCIAYVRFSDMAHTRDCTSENIMLDPSGMYPGSFHPVDIERSKDFRQKAKWYSRTRRPTRYLLIDFGLSRQYDPANGPPLEKPLRGGDKSAPEHQDMNTPCNPFPTDVYYLGNLVREDYMQVYAFISPTRLTVLTGRIQKYKGFEFMAPLVTDMVQDDPTKRPTMDDVVKRFSEIKTKLSTWKLRSRLPRKNEIWPVTAFKTVRHWYWTVGYVLGRKAAIPEPK